jgi:hypothetical protein
VVLGSRGSLGRCLLVWVTGTSILGAVARTVLPVAGEGWSHRAAPSALPLDRALVDLAAVVLVGCAVWAWLALTVTVLEARRGPHGSLAGHGARNRARPWHLPAGTRRLVLAGCGVALATGLTQPALADPGGHTGRGVAVLSGLPLPDRASVALPQHQGPRPSAPAAPASSAVAEVRRQVVVRTGDCLWSIAAHDLPSGSSDAAVATRWHEIYAANHSVLGPDPDVIAPGLRLTLPPLPGKDPS